MKKALFLFFLCLVISFTSYAEGIALGTFPTGKWLDTRYNAVWEFSVSNIRILDLKGGIYYDFSGKTITDFKVGLEEGELVLRFSCTETDKTYKFTKPANLTDLSIKLTIDRPGKSTYEIKMPVYK